MYRLGAAKHVVAIDTFGSQRPEGFSAVPRIDSFAPDPDVVRSLDPTAVIASFDSQVEGLTAANIACPILVLKAPSGEDIVHQIIEQLCKVAEFVGAGDSADKVAEEIHSRVSAMQAAAVPLAGHSFFLELDSELFTASNHTFLGHMFSVKLGLRNVADSFVRTADGNDYFQVSMEWIKTRDPHFYIVAHTGTPAISKGCGLDAVSSGRVVQTPVHYDRVAWSPDLLDVVENSLKQMLQHQQIVPHAPLSNNFQPPSYEPAKLAEAFREALSFDGFDLVKPFCVGWYNDVLTKLASAWASCLRPLPDFGRGSTCLAVVIGNTRSVWTPFLMWMRGKASRLELKDPFDTFVHETIERACGKLLCSVPHQMFWACDETIERMVAMQRVAEVAGMAELDHSTHLCVHETYGTWISLRAVIVCDLAAADLIAPEPQKSLLSADEKQRAAVALRQALEAHENPKLLCEELHGNGLESCERSLEIWRQWVALRDVVEVGKNYRFCQAQIEYHYTKDRCRLRDVVLENPQGAALLA